MSNLGYGIYFNGAVVSEKRTITEHINLAELRVLQEVVSRFRGQMEDSLVTWRCDNFTATRVLIKQGSTKSWRLCRLAVEILEQAERKKIRSDPIYVCSEENWLMDAASQLKMTEDWGLKSQVFDRIAACFGQPDVDIMASELSRKCHMFRS